LNFPKRTHQLLKIINPPTPVSSSVGWISLSSGQFLGGNKSKKLSRFSKSQNNSVKWFFLIP
jgi:hypothetical protein